VARSVENYRSLLFVGAHDTVGVARALGSEADAVVIDLEDLTPGEAKDEARRQLPAHTGSGRSSGAIAVRINTATPSILAADLAAVHGLAIDALVIPKATPDLLRGIGDVGTPVIAVIETAAGLRQAFEVACSDQVAALAFGANDLAADLRLRSPISAGNLAYARAKLVVDSAAAGVRAPFDRVVGPSVSMPLVVADARTARDAGFGGKGCIGAEQAAHVNRVFARGRLDPDPVAY
jgi:citrate lyase subunit beta/citryl-CoA lyase